MDGNRSTSGKFILPYFYELRCSFSPVTGFPLRSNKAFRGKAVVIYREPLITQQMGESAHKNGHDALAGVHMLHGNLNQVLGL